VGKFADAEQQGTPGDGPWLLQFTHFDKISMALILTSARHTDKALQRLQVLGLCPSIFLYVLHI
jgi:hypothetical protein